VLLFLDAFVFLKVFFKVFVFLGASVSLWSFVSLRVLVFIAGIRSFGYSIYG
jgi:hypothetical protein